MVAPDTTLCYGVLMRTLKTECVNGHLYSDENTYWDPRGKRQCRTCRAESQRKQIRDEGTSYRKLHERMLPWPDRFWINTKPKGACIAWTGTITPEGYGLYSGRYAHRVSYELNGGTLIPGMHIDHKCFVRNCVNPAHLEQVTQVENVRRSWKAGHLQSNGAHLAAMKLAKTECPQGHPYSGENLRIEPCSGARRCKICDYAKAKRWKERNN